MTAGVIGAVLIILEPPQTMAGCSVLADKCPYVASFMIKDAARSLPHDQGVPGGVYVGEAYYSGVLFPNE